MDHEQVLRIARRERDRARALTRKGKLSLAHDVLSNVVTLLDSALDAVNDAAVSRNELASVLADTYGMLGGVARRIGDLAGAVAAYDNGRRIEQNPLYDISDSYNLTNSIVVRILLDPWLLEQLSPQVAAASATVRQQVGGPRRDQWWAWADYGLLNLLLDDDDEVDRAYSKFFECGAKAADIKSVSGVLRSLADAVVQVDLETHHRLIDRLAKLEESVNERA